MNLPAPQPNAPQAVAKTTYPTVDFAKFLMAFAIVGIHTQVFSQYRLLDMGFDLFSRTAVPFFFIASGFFFFSAPISLGRVLKFTKRVLVLYLIYSALFLTIHVMQEVPSPWFWIFTLIKGFRHLWFLHALLLGLPLTAGMLHLCRKKPGIVYAIAGICLLARWGTSTYWPLFSSIPGSEPVYAFFYDLWHQGLWNIICYALPCLALGHALAVVQPRSSVRIAVVGLAVSLVLLCFEACFSIFVLHTLSRTIFLSSLLVAFFCMLLCLQFQWPHNSTVAHFLRKSSTLIYCIHPLFLLFISNWLQPGIGAFCAVSACSMLFAFLVYWGAKQKRGKWLRYLQ